MLSVARLATIGLLSRGSMSVAQPHAVCLAMKARNPNNLPEMKARNPNNLPEKVCVVCQRPFTWRKKWERCWDDVTTCSKRCNNERKRSNRIARGAADAEGEDAMQCDVSSDASDGAAEKANKKAAKKAAKAERRARREGVSSGGQKACDLCARSVDLLIRCEIDRSSGWRMVCGRCWKTPAVAGGVPDGDGQNPNYRYGGLWKNLHRTT